MREEQKRLRESIEKGVRNEKIFELLQKERWGYFKRFDTLLYGTSTGPHWLGQLDVAEIVVEAMHYRDGVVYDLIAYSIMPNHVHMILENVRLGPVRRADCPSNSPLTEVLRKLKWNTALRANRALHRSGPFWQNESYDHVIRNDAELERTIWYVLENPVRAKLATSWNQWPWNYCKWNPE